MFNIFAEAFSLIRRHFLLLSALLLTVRLPLNLLSYFLYYESVVDANGYFLIYGFSTTLFDPIYIAALLFVLYSTKQGETPLFGEAVGVGLRHWGSLLYRAI